jgi:hypothetical protein
MTNTISTIENSVTPVTSFSSASGITYWIKDNNEFHSSELHRETGPAVEFPNGICRWYLNDKQYTFAQWLDQIDCTLETRTMLILKWGSHA